MEAWQRIPRRARSIIAHYANLKECLYIRHGLRGLGIMTHSIALREVPGKLLDRAKWNQLRKSASQEITALAYINAIHPDDEVDPVDFFWDRRGSAASAVRCFEIGRSLLDQCRLLLNRGALIATG